jgi:hypothetical protein
VDFAVAVGLYKQAWRGFGVVYVFVEDQGASLILNLGGKSVQ